MLLKSTLTFQVTNRNTFVEYVKHSCSYHFTIPRTKKLSCTYLFVRYILPTPKKGELPQHGRKFHGCCKDEEIPAYSCIIELKDTCSF